MRLREREREREREKERQRERERERERQRERERVLKREKRGRKIDIAKEIIIDSNDELCTVSPSLRCG